MSIETTKIMNLADGKVLYDDLRGRIDAKYTKPGTGIPATDLADGVIPVLTTLIDDTAGNGDTNVTWSADKSHDEIDAIVTVSDTQPQQSGNKLWIEEDAEEEYSIPTTAEMTAGLAAKVNKPSSEGTSGQVLRTNGNGSTYWDDDANATDIANAVTDWLDTNVPTGTTVVVDSSLTISGAAADSKKTGDEISDLKSAIGVLEPAATSSDVGKFLKAKTVADGKVTEYEFGEGGGGVSDYSDLANKPQINGTTLAGNKSLSDIGVHNVPSGGSSGDVLKKASGTNYDLVWGSVAAPSDEQVAEAVTAWLDDHPEATTTVEDGSITRAKLNSSLANEIDGKAPAIMDTVENQYSFADVVSPATLNYRYSAAAFGNARYADHLNYMPIASLDTSKNEVDFTVVDRTIIVDGVASSSSSIYAIDDDVPVQVPPGNYTFHFEVDKGSSTISYGQNIIIRAVYTDNTQGDILTKLVQATNVTADVTTSKTIKHIRVEFYFTAKNTYSNHRVWIGMYPSGTVFTDVGEPVTDGSDVSVTINGITTPSVVDTVQHKSNCTYPVDTKTYVDNNIPDNVITETDIGFLTPEMFGAVGDGTTDDTQALLDCITASRLSTDVAIPIRGCNRYKISSSIEFSGKNNNVFLHDIVYTGDDAAVILHGQTSRFEFDEIQAMSANTAVGIRVTTTQEEGFNKNSVSCISLVTKGNGIEFVNSNASKTIYYNTFSFKSQASAYGNLIVINGNDINEIDLYGKVILAGNGYFIYDYNTEPQSIIRLHNYCIETGVKYGINTRVSMAECRTEEFFVNPGVPHEDPKTGVLFDFTGKVPHGGTLTDDKTKISYASVDVSDAMSYEDAIDYVASVYKDASSSQRHTLFIRYIAPVFPEFKYMSQYLLNERIICSMIVYYNHKAVKPNSEWYYKVSADFDAGVNNNDYIVPTFFDVDASSVVINLDYSYCYLAINRFKVRQYENKKAIVYDKLGNLLFDGTNESAGVYEFECEFIKHDPITLDLGGGDTYTYESSYSDRVYDGTNEVWHIYKKELVST